jgi:hypothetical protein
VYVAKQSFKGFYASMVNFIGAHVNFIDCTAECQSKSKNTKLFCGHLHVYEFEAFDWQQFKHILELISKLIPAFVKRKVHVVQFFSVFA